MNKSGYQEDILRFISHFNASVNNIRLYSMDHPQVKKYIRTAYTILIDIFRVKKEMTLLLIDNDLVVDNTPIRSAGAHIVQFVSILKESGIERITLVAGLTGNGFSGFIREFASSDDSVIRSSQFIKLGKIDVKVKKEAADTMSTLSKEEKENLEELMEVRDLKYSEIKQLYHSMKAQKQVDVRGVDDMIKSFIKGFAHGLNPINLLASIKSADEYTFTHVVNVCILTMSQAESLGFKGKHLYQIGIASALHDVGKLFIPDEIISKPGKLTQNERKIIEGHSVKGARYILRMKEIPKLAVLGALEHHIRYDGTGYPELKGDWQPNIVSQMIAIADVFDAMRSRRPYQEPKPMELILQILEKEKGTTFNPVLVDNFFNLIK
ncbi:MAG: HD domain-containing protein [Deltaproteobacteria bacterium]|nr:HD domain-containing protein [Deltaproteobacteria bacterium]MBW2218460.1 HD domain-containing protein [Deltaproteobacteria bacterium]